ncbi:hypothetical protein [Paraliobacillus ryukyuensis]|uniref:hypothetical protein n=1 Tax=Paraliobacillus ryukyuensis TaxID=200904 RepID=UPI0009A7FC4D|nr:hypothetical protein [Paraliobacillus ryukyuensis]
MNEQRKDSLDKYYKTVNTSSFINMLLFWATIILSLVIHFVTKPEWETWINVVFIFFSLLFFLVNNILTIELIPRAEKKRKTHLLSNSLNVPLDNERTNLYYNNLHSSSILRLGLNVFENALFSFKVSEKMLLRERTKVFLYITLWVLLLLIRQTQVELLSIIAQTLFSTSLLSNWIRLELYKREMEQTFEKCRSLFLQKNKQEIVPNTTVAEILDLTIGYESLKARMGISLSTRVFQKINPEVSKEWERIKGDLEIK